MAGGAQGILQIDNDYTGSDFSASIKAFNPYPFDGGLTGIFVGSYLQSVTPSLALGFEAIWQRQALNTRPESTLSYCAKYRGEDWIASAQLQAQGVIAASYWRKLSERVEAGVDMNLQFAPSAAAMMMGGPSREGTATLGAKYDFRASTFRAQVDSAGKVSCLLEKRIAVPISLSFAGEIDQVKVRYISGNFFFSQYTDYIIATSQSRSCRVSRNRERRPYGAARKGRGAGHYPTSLLNLDESRVRETDTFLLMFY
jgi:mitochondrial import receptor subunit TOM40